MACDLIARNASTTFDCSYLTDIMDFLNGSMHNCSQSVLNDVQARHTQLSCIPNPDLERAMTIVIIFIVSLIGNIGTIVILSRFKIHKVPDILVIGLALTDLLATAIPIPMSMVSYFRGVNYVEGTVECDLFGVLAHFTRYSSIAIVSLVSLERYFAVNRPFIYRKYATPKRFVLILLFCWLLAFILAVAPAIDPNSTISQHQGYCLFDLSSHYAISILIFAAINYVIVFVCFILVTINLLRVYRRRKKLRVQGQYNRSSKAGQRDHPLTFTKPNLTARISDLGKTLKKAAPVITEKFQLGVEAQFARMLFAVVALFYLSWTTIVILVTIAQIRRSQIGLETALFWGIRLSIISTAINPFLYGILARQYRLAYWYVIKLALSKCCYCCINPPLKDVFAAARNIGGDVRNGAAGQKNKYGTQRSEGGSDYWSRNSQGVLLTHTTHTLLGNAIPVAFHPGRPGNHLQIIPEDFSEHTSNAAEFSTHVPTAGELSSSVTIPQQARDVHESHQMDMKIRGAASMHDLVDLGLDELGNSSDPMSGAENPLAMITGMVNGKEVIVSPINSDSSSDMRNSPPLFSNPLYEMTNPVHPKSREAMEAEMEKRQQLLAASSTDDITLLSKKKHLRSPHRFSDVPTHSVPDNTFGDSSFLKRPSSMHNKFNLGSTPPAHSRSRKTKTGKAGRDGNIPDIATSVQKIDNDSPPVIRATDIDSGLSVLVPTKTSSDSTGGRTTTPIRSANRVTVHEEVVQPASNRRPVTVVHTSIYEPPPVVLSQESVDSLRQKRSSNPQVNQSDVSLLRDKFEKGSSSRGRVGHNDSLHVSSSRSTSDSQTKSKSGVKRKNSTENSDSGRESMMDSADNGVPEIPSTSF